MNEHFLKMYSPSILNKYVGGGGYTFLLDEVLLIFY